MALVTCKECKKEISDHARTCPHCGVMRTTKAEKIITRIFIGFVVFMVVAPFLGAGLSSSPSPSEPEVQVPERAEVREEPKPVNLKSAAMALQKCVQTRLAMDDYITDLTLSPLENMVKKCQYVFGEVVFACSDDCKAKKAECNFDSCAANIKMAIERDLQVHGGLY